jgi:hypothetical protein
MYDTRFHFPIDLSPLDHLTALILILFLPHKQRLPLKENKNRKEYILDKLHLLNWLGGT